MAGEPRKAPQSLWTPGGEVSFAQPFPMTRYSSASKSGVDNSPAVAEMRMLRQATQRKTAALQRTGQLGGGGFGSQVDLATSRPRDPMFYWRQNNIPFLYQEDEGARQIREFANLIYMTHPVIASCIDTYSMWPLTGMKVSVAKDEKLEEFYSTLFLDTLDYEAYLPSLLKQVWLRGEAFPLGQFDELLGVWEDDQLIDPDSVKVIDSPFFRESRYEMRIPESIRKIVETRDPEWEFRQLVRSQPEIVKHAQIGDYIPVDNTLMRHIALKLDDFHPRGVSILMRAFRSITQEEMLNSAIDAVASRLYTPLILVKLGAPASDMGTDVAWVPTADDLEEFNAALDMALLGDFRVLTSHFATDISAVFGKEVMPSFAEDFDRIMSRQLMAFGLSETLLSGASSGETYAADALNRDVVTLLLSRSQRWIKRFFRDRAMVVAEAQEHYDYEEHGGQKKTIYHDVKETDEESGEVRIVHKPKLLLPQLEFDVLNLNDRDTERQFVEALVGSGMPVSRRRRLKSVPDIDFDNEMEAFATETVEIAVATATTRKRAYLALKQQGLPIPQDLIDDFEPKAAPPGGFEDGAVPGSGDAPLPDMGMDPMEGTNMVSSPEDYAAAEQEGGMPPNAPSTTTPFPSSTMPLSIVPQVPPESSEARGRMPKASRLSRTPRRSLEPSPEDLRETEGLGIYEVS